MHKIVILSLSLFTLFQLNAQITVTIIEDDPTIANPFRLRVPIWQISPATYNLSAYDARFGIDYVPHDKLMLNLDYCYSLLDRLSPDTQAGLEYPSQAHMVGQYEYTHSNYLNAEMTFFVASKTEEEELNINLGYRGNVRYYTMVPGKVQRSVGLRFGQKRGITWYHFGETFIKYENDANVPDDIVDRSTMLSYTQLRLGLAFQIKTNLQVHTDSYGNSSNAGISYVHFDILPTLKSNVDDVFFVNPLTSPSNTYTYFLVGINDVNEKSKLGFEVGGRFIPTATRMSYHLNLGRIPGFIDGPNGYLEMGVSLSLGKKILSQQVEGRPFEAPRRK